VAQSLTYHQMGTVARGQAHALFSQTMGYVAVTAGLFAFGAWLGRDLTGGAGIVAFIAAFACLIGMRFATRRSAQLTVGLLVAFGLLIGLAVAPTVAYYGSMDPRALWEAGGSAALFVAGFGAAGYATRRDLSALARISFWALVALIVAGIVLIFVHIPGAELVYSILGLVIFAGFTMFDFQRLRTSTDEAAAPLLAASIFLDLLNVFLFFLEIFSGGDRRLSVVFAPRAVWRALGNVHHAEVRRQWVQIHCICLADDIVQMCCNSGLKAVADGTQTATPLPGTRAAKRELIVQSGLSNSLQALERELGTPVYVRGTRPARLAGP
jgi:FtsH-binding integral membrane protein